MEMLLTVEQAAERLQLRPFTVRDQLKRGVLRGIKRGRVWRVPESALFERSPASQVVQGEAARLAALERLHGALAGTGLELEDFLSERRADVDLENGRREGSRGAV